MQSKTIYSWGGLLMLAIVFLALTMITGSLFRGARLDLTENALYTLSDGTKNILSQVEEPIQVQLFFSEAASEDLPQIRSYYQRVRELLEEFKQRAGGNLLISYVDPAPFSEAEDQAAAYGLQAVPVNASGDALYFGLVASNAIDGTEVMPFLQPDKEEFLEYDLAKILYTLNQPDKLRVGLLSGLAMTGGFDPQRQAPTPPWALYEQLQQSFEIENILPNATELPADIAMLVLVHPKALSEDLQYQIDQFVLGGGRVLAFVDPRSEVPDPSQQQQQMPGVSQGSGSSDLPELFGAWGVDFDDANVVGDARFALQVTVAQGQPPVRHVGILGLSNGAFAQDDIVTADLNSINLSSAGHFTRSEGATVDLQPLLISSDNSMLIDANRLMVLNNPADLLNGFQASGTSYNLSVRLTGTVNSAFGERAAGNNGLLEGEINVILIGDTDVLTDRFWVQRQNFFGQTLTSAFANNADLVINAVDNLIGNGDLISIRTRAVSSRPFDRVDDLRVAAELRLRETEQQLQQQLRETEQRLNELQTNRNGDDQEASLAVFTAEQEAEIKRFLDQKLTIRRELRQVRRELDKDIEALGTRLKVINILIVPLLVAVLAIFLARRRRRS